MGPSRGPPQILTLMLIISFAETMALIHYPECLEQCEDSGDEEGYVDEPTREGYRDCDVEESAGQYQESP